MDIYQKFSRKSNVSFKSKSSYQQKILSKTPVSLLGFVSLFIATCFLLKLIIEGIENSPLPSFGGAYGIKKIVLGTFHEAPRKYSICGNCRYTMY